MPSLPGHRYVPGQTARHPEEAFDFIRAQAPKPTLGEAAAQNITWLYGLRLFDAGFWWEAHEVLEPVWMNARPNSVERAMVQAIIQVANAALKREMGRPNAIARLCDIAGDHLRETSAGGPAVMGLSTAKVDQAIEAVRVGAPPPRLSG